MVPCSASCVDVPVTREKMKNDQDNTFQLQWINGISARLNRIINLMTVTLLNKKPFDQFSYNFIIYLFR